MISAYLIGARVWLVATPTVAQEEVPETVPIGSLILDYDEAARLLAQLGMAVGKLEQRKGRE
jgi:hypothetical protein